ncbi:MAG TPA: hypothetical protein VNZ52_03280 [Candidatus Thermoplasmatota archaeon]|nr:hypothetical protein [Candidatus Thermoplasmatota archaeon]
MATITLGNVTLEGEIELEFIDGAALPSILGGAIRIEKAITTEQAAAVAAAIRGLDNTPFKTPHGHGVLSIKAMQWNPTTGVLNSFQGVALKSWTWAVEPKQGQPKQLIPNK